MPRELPLLDAVIAGLTGTVGDALHDALRGSIIGLFKTGLVERGDGTWSGGLT